LNGKFFFVFLFSSFVEGRMKNIGELEYCVSIYDGNVARVSTIVLYWYYFAVVMLGCSKIVLVLTKAAGRGTGFHVDIYAHQSQVSDKCLRTKIREVRKKEKLILISSLRIAELFLKYFSNRLKGLP